MKPLLPLLLSLLAITATTLAQDDIDIDPMLEEVMDADLPEQEIEIEEEEPRERPLYKIPVLQGKAHFTATFDTVGDFNKQWVKSLAKKDGADEDIAKYDGQWSVEEPVNPVVLGDRGLVLKSRAKHHAVSAKLNKPFDFSGGSLIVQYEVKFQNGQDCGGAYVKLLSQGNQLSLTNFMDKTPYTIMFGPDRCGNDNKLHFIFRHKNPLTGEFEEKHAKKPTGAIDTFFTDKKTHLFTLVVNPDNSFEVLVDQAIVSSGSLLEDVEPAVNPAKEIVDPSEKKPADWDEREKIPDPDAIKPEDWDETEPEMIEDETAEKPEGWLDDEEELMSDPDAGKPEDWDDDMDGEWEAPMINNPVCEAAPGCGEWKTPTIKNPNYKGKWKAPVIDNPDYRGKWKPGKIANPDFFEDLEPYKMTPIGAIGLELWSMSDDILFDNFIITDDRDAAEKWAADTWAIKNAEETASSRSVVGAVMDATKERPWLWAVIIVVVVLPVILIIAYCCMSGSSPSDKDADRKKTDEPTPDVAEEEEEEEEDEEEGEEEVDEGGAGDATPAAAAPAPAAPAAAPKKSGKAKLEEAEDNEEEEAAADESPAADDESPAADDESPAADDESPAPEEESAPTAKRSTRNRKKVQKE